MDHPCYPCRFAFITKCYQPKLFYNALTDKMQEISVSLKDPCCGHGPSSVVLDKKRPYCSCFEKDEND